MLEEYERKRQKQVSFMRSMLDYVMGVVMIGLGCLLFFHDKLKIPIREELSPKVVKTLGVIVVLYGAWRLYKGFKKNYFQ